MFMVDFQMNNLNVFGQEDSFYVENVFNRKYFVVWIDNVKNLKFKNLWGMNFWKILWKLYKYLSLKWRCFMI